MTRTITHLKVKDFAAFKEGFAAGAAMRKAHGAQGAHLFRSQSDPNAVLVVIEWANAEQAHQFFASSELRERQQQVGVLGKPEAYDEIETYPA